MNCTSVQYGLKYMLFRSLRDSFEKEHSHVLKERINIGI